MSSTSFETAQQLIQLTEKNAPKERLLTLQTKLASLPHSPSLPYKINALAEQSLEHWKETYYEIDFTSLSFKISPLILVHIGGFFTGLLGHEFKENRQKILTIQCISNKIAQILKDYFLTRSFQKMTKELFCPLIEAADRFILTDLFAKCLEWVNLDLSLIPQTHTYRLELTDEAWVTRLEHFQNDYPMHFEKLLTTIHIKEVFISRIGLERGSLDGFMALTAQDDCHISIKIGNAPAHSLNRLLQWPDVLLKKVTTLELDSKTSNNVEEYCRALSLKLPNLKELLFYTPHLDLGNVVRSFLTNCPCIKKLVAIGDLNEAIALSPNTQVETLYFTIPKDSDKDFYQAWIKKHPLKELTLEAFSLSDPMKEAILATPSLKTVILKFTILPRLLSELKQRRPDIDFRLFS